MIITLLKQIDAKLGEIIKILHQPEDYSREDKTVNESKAAVKAATTAVSEAKDRIPH
jgi:hypothetical protein